MKKLLFLSCILLNLVVSAQTIPTRITTYKSLQNSAINTADARYLSHAALYSAYSNLADIVKYQNDSLNSINATIVASVALKQNRADTNTAKNPVTLTYGLNTYQSTADSNTAKHFTTKTYVDNKTAYIYFGAGSPENAVIAPVGSLYSRTDGTDDAVFYIKVTGTGNTGWIAQANP